MTGFALRRIIDGLAYDTETSTFIARGDHGHEMSQASWTLYRTRRGAFFEVVAGHDGVIQEVNPLTDEQARRFLETNASYLVEKYFGPIPEAGPVRFSRRTVIAAIQMMKPFNHADLTLFLQKLGPGLASRVGENGYISQRLNKLIALALEELPPNYPVDGGEVLQDALVENAVTLLPGYGHDSDDPEKEAAHLPPIAAEFVRELERDGFTVSGGMLRRTLPVEIELPAAQSDMDGLLVKHRFAVAKGQLEQAIDAHARGKWAGANGQFRPFLEGLLDEIAARLEPPVGEPLRGHASRSKLASIGFLRRDLNEWDDDGRGFINGLMNRLHPEGPHPGLSDDEDSTFRLHVVLLTARLLLTRFDTWGRG
jgi:hypothetical protein